MNNQTIDTILNRRSIRKYKQEQVSDRILEQILQCALYSPSALNKQPWQVRIVQNKAILDTINQSFAEWAKGKQLSGSASRAQEKDFSVFHHAPTLIIVAADKDNHYAEGDCGMLAQNIMLAAHSLSIGSCTIGNVAHIINDSTYIAQELLHINTNNKVLFGIAIGYPDEQPEAKHRDTRKFEWIR